jgi:hypothetical protein
MVNATSSGESATPTKIGRPSSTARSMSFLALAGP